jgi:hypothetical protein
MISSVSCVSSSTPDLPGLRRPNRPVARRSRRARGESDPRARGDSEGPTARLPAPGLSTASDDQGHPASAGNHPNFHSGTGAAAARHRGLSGISAGCVHAARARDNQLFRVVELTVAVRSVPHLSVRCGTRMARRAGQARSDAGHALPPSSPISYTTKDVTWTGFHSLGGCSDGAVGLGSREGTA